MSKDLTKQELIKAVAEATGESQVATNKIIAETIEQIQTVVSAGGSVAFTGFGKFDSLVRGERNGRNLHTGEAMVIPEHRVPRFKAGKTFKDMVK